MRIAKMIFMGSVAALAMTAPVLAKNPESQKTDDKSDSASCHAYQQAPDGSWTALPCQEFGNGQTQHRPPAKGGEEERR
ncbi:MAG TPA: hypothetical protein VHJ00_13340 [Bradyrhizobium sp.]|jgi:hypothetical protein|nr:hypothetical protein [Bradyrhizobium sp.]